jgi:NitT/TauT family transport system substrate-binding protein
MAIMESRGLLAKHGADVETILYDSYDDLLSDLGSGKLDACFTVLYEVLRSSIPGVKVTLATDYSAGAEGLVVVPEITTPGDLKGKRIGIQGGGSGSEYVITSFLRKHGMVPSDLVLVDLAPEHILLEMPDNVQGGYTWDPYLSEARTRSYKILFSTAEVPGLIVDVVAFRGEAVQNRREDVRGFHAAWFEALDFWASRPAEAAELISRRIGVTVQPGPPAGCRLLDLQANRAAFTPGPTFASLHHSGQHQIDFFMELGGASVKPDLNEILDPSFLPPAP